METLKEKQKFEYMMLARLQLDNDYYLGNGNGNKKHLWAGNVEDQIQEMIRLFNLLETKPEWISLDDINNYKLNMIKKSQEKKKV